MTIKEQIAEIDKQIKELRIKKQELYTQLSLEPLSTTLNELEENWYNLDDEITKSYFDRKDDFLEVQITKQTSTTPIFNQFLHTDKKYLLLKNFFKIRYHNNNDFFSTKYDCYCSLIIIKNWKKISREANSLTISELKKFAGSDLFSIQNESEVLKNLYYEINGFPKEEVFDSLSSGEDFKSTPYLFTKPIQLHAQSKQKQYGKTREFLIVGVVMHDVHFLF